MALSKRKAARLLTEVDKVEREAKVLKGLIDALVTQCGDGVVVIAPETIEEVESRHGIIQMEKRGDGSIELRIIKVTEE